jgi:N-acetylglucosaminyl-diphospho-decaprenol L-rhamnosyltransferase
LRAPDGPIRSSAPVTLSIIIVSFNARADLERCLESLAQHPPAVSHEVLVVDNGSSDSSVEAARRRPEVQVVAIGENRGFAAANNTGIRASTGKHLLLLNSDTLVPSGAIDRLLGALERHPEAAAAGPRLVDSRGHAELSFGRMIGPITEWRRQRLMRRHARADPAAVAAIEAMTREEQFPDWVSGACLLVRRADAEAVGLLDERFFMYTEDVDFCAALRAQGRRILFTPAAEIVHLRGRSAATAPAATRAAYRRSHLTFYEKHHPAFAPFLRLYHRLRG